VDAEFVLMIRMDI